MERTLPRWALVLATVTSAGLFWFGTGLTLVPALTWLAPLPVLAVGMRAPGWATACAAATAWAGGGLNMWTYLHDGIQLPAAIVVAFLTVQALVFAATTVLVRDGRQRSRSGRATMAGT